MDPIEALANALANLHYLLSRSADAEDLRHTRADAIEALEALTGWMKRDGFPPDVPEAIRRASLA